MAHTNAARKAANDNYRPCWKPGMPVPQGYYRSVNQPDMIFKTRSACDTIELETPQVPVSEITTEPYAAEGKRLAIEVRQRWKKAERTGGYSDYFNWRQSIGKDYYDTLDRLAGRVAANDNAPDVRKVAA